MNLKRVTFTETFTTKGTTYYEGDSQTLPSDVASVFKAQDRAVDFGEEPTKPKRSPEHHKIQPESGRHDQRQSSP